MAQKLYTEEQVKQIAIQIMNYGFHDVSDFKQYHNPIIPIELPSDEEIEEGLFHQSNEYAYGYKDAFKLIREQISKK